MATSLVLLFGGFALRKQRKELEAQRELAIHEVQRERDERLAQAAHVATMGTFAMGVVHEVATPLGVIVARAEQLRARAGQDDRGTHAAQSILVQVDRIQHVIRRFLDMARGGGGSDEMGYPDWYWDWANWYLTTDRDPDARPSAAPKDIPKWAWDANDEVQRINKRFGMTTGERDWIDWYLGGKEGKRPDVPDTIPPRWWDDETWALRRE